MSVRKRSWTTPNGEAREAWIVDYRDQHGDRHIKTFDRKRDADAHHAKVAVDVKAGTHTAESRSVTVNEAGELWLKSREAEEVEPTTLAQYRQHFEHHIRPLIGATKLAALTVPFVRTFEDRLRSEIAPTTERVRSATMVRKVMASLSSILSDALDRGLVAQNVVHHRRSRNKKKKGVERQKRQLKVGRDIPTPEEIRAILTKLDDQGRHRALLLTAIFTGLRASELRGLRWTDIDFAKSELHVHQRADRHGRIGAPKSATSRRAIPLLPMVVNALKAWKLASPPCASGLVFPSPGGRPLWLETIVDTSWHPVQVAAGVIAGKDKPKYPGLHALRHFYASWCINRKVDGGLELPIKVVQGRLGHASIQMTADTYGHLFPRQDDGAEMAAAERAFLTAT
jgi:integrase